MDAAWGPGRSVYRPARPITARGSTQSLRAEPAGGPPDWVQRPCGLFVPAGTRPSNEPKLFGFAQALEVTK